MSPMSAMGLFPRAPATNTPQFNHARDTSTDFQAQWQNPSDILSLLLILGPDVVWRALAQLCGGLITPTVFSFGWVAFAVNALVAAFGDAQIMPQPDYQVTVVGAKSGHTRTNKAWIIGRLLRDFEHSLRGELPKKRDVSRTDYEALRVTVFQVNAHRTAGEPDRDWVWYSGFVVALLQIAIAVLPMVLYTNYAPLMVTIGGSILALLHGGIFQWREEKWACPKKGGWTTSLTQGNGSRNVMVILGNTHGLDLEILAGKSQQFVHSNWTRAYVSVLAILWLVLLVSVAGLTDNSWYLLAIGLVGMVHNIFVAAVPRSPGALGVHIDQIDTIKDKSVVKVLQKAETTYPMVGSSLVPIFFPGGMRVAKGEKEFWAEAMQKRESQGLSKLAIRVD